MNLTTAFCTAIIASLLCVAFSATKSIDTSDFKIEPFAYDQEFDPNDNILDTFELDFKQDCLEKDTCAGMIYVIGESGQIEVDGVLQDFSFETTGDDIRMNIGFTFLEKGVIKIMPSSPLLEIRVDLFPRNEDYDLMIAPIYRDENFNIVDDLSKVKAIDFHLLPRTALSLDWSVPSAFDDSDVYEFTDISKYFNCSASGGSTEMSITLLRTNTDHYTSIIIENITTRCVVEVKQFLEDQWDSDILLDNILWFDKFKGNYELWPSDLKRVVVQKDEDAGDVLHVIASLPQILSADDVNELEHIPMTKAFEIPDMLMSYPSRYKFDFSSLACLKENKCFVYVAILGESGTFSVGSTSNPYTVNFNEDGGVTGTVAHRVSSASVVEVVAGSGTHIYNLYIDIIPTGTYSTILLIGGNDSSRNVVRDSTTTVATYDLMFIPNPAKAQSWGLQPNAFAETVFVEQANLRDTYLSNINGTQEDLSVGFINVGPFAYAMMGSFEGAATVDVKKFLNEKWNGTLGKILVIDPAKKTSTELSVDEVSPLKIMGGTSGLSFEIPGEDKSFLQKGLDYAKDNVALVAGIGGGVLLLIILLCCMCCKKSNDYGYGAPSMGGYGGPGMGGYGGAPQSYGYGRGMGPPMRGGMY